MVAMGSWDKKHPQEQFRSWGQFFFISQRDYSNISSMFPPALKVASKPLSSILHGL